jgi:hypothetical protein
VKKHELYSLRHDAGRVLGVHNPEEFGEYGRLTLDSISMGLFADENDEQSDLIYCYVDLGKVDNANRLQSYENLLALNLTMGGRGNGVFSYDPGSDSVIMTSQLPVANSVDPELLANLLQEYARLAHTIRTNML